MFRSTALLLVAGLLSSSGLVQAAEQADQQPVVAPAAEGIPVQNIIDAVASRSKQRFLVDPRVSGNVNAPELDLRKISYRDMQAILGINGFAVVEEAGFVKIIPEEGVRTMQLPVIDKDSANVGSDDYVIRRVSTGKLTAVQLVPVLRPLLPQQAHMVGIPASNSLLIAARYGNIKTIETIIRSLEQAAADVKTPVSSAAGE